MKAKGFQRGAAAAGKDALQGQGREKFTSVCQLGHVACVIFLVMQRISLPHNPFVYGHQGGRRQRVARDMRVKRIACIERNRISIGQVSCNRVSRYGSKGWERSQRAPQSAACHCNDRGPSGRHRQGVWRDKRLNRMRQEKKARSF